MTTQFVVQGQPIGKIRPRFALKGGHVQAYTPPKSTHYERQIGKAYKLAGGQMYPEDVAVKVTIRIGLRIPLSVSRKKHEAMVCGLIRPLTKPDTDNVIKSVLDGLNGVAYADDKQVTCVRAVKLYDDVPHITVTVSEDN